MSTVFGFHQLVDLCRQTHETMQSRAVRSVDLTLVVRNWLFGWYIANFAYRGYQQAFGILSLLIVVMTYLYVASIAFLVGAELDALLVTEATKRRR